MDTVLALTFTVIITCQDCQSQYEVADEKVHGRSVRIRCRSCGSRIFLSLEATTPSHGHEAERLPPRNAIFAPPIHDDSADATAPRSAHGAPLDDQPATGGRNETSVLFTLAALAGTRKVSKAAAPAAPAKKEDSGLIDLNAMSTSELTSRSVKAPVLSEPPLGNFTTSVSYTPPAQTRRAHFYGAGIAAVALLAMIGLGFGMRGEKIESADVVASMAPVVHAAAAAQPAAPVAAPAPAAPAPEVVASVSPDAKPAAPSKGKGKKAAKHQSGVKASGLKKISSTGVSPAPHVAAAPRSAASDPCNCHGNLMCSMNCSAK